MVSGMLGVCEFVAIIAALAFTSRSDGSARTIDSTYISSVKRYDGVTGMCIGPIAHAVLFFVRLFPFLLPSAVAKDSNDSYFTTPHSITHNFFRLAFACSLKVNSRARPK
ncbi:hypothetical protein FRC08_010311 [Ceratobasidium sp. 394]|nr:hypothetical protein FRC08_010311 [Ceratobasidium sp. 394]